MVRRLLLVTAVAGCHGNHDAAPIAGSGSVAAAPALRTDRAPTRLGGALQGGRGTLATAWAIEVCPGDQELVVAEDTGWLRRIRLADGAQLAITALTARDAAALANTEPDATDGATWITEPGSGKLDCRPDGTAIAVGAIARTHVLLGDGPGMSATPDKLTIPFTVDAKGVRTRVAGTATEARFAADGAPRWLDASGVWELRDGKPVQILDSKRAAIANAGVYFEFVPAEGSAEPFTKMFRAGKTLRLPGLAYFNEASVTPDGSVVASVGFQAATSWIAAGGRMKPYDLLQTSHLAPVGGAKYFAAVAFNAVWDAERPGNRWDHVDKVCGDDGGITALAMTHDETRLILGCAQHGLRVMAIDSAEITPLGEQPIGGDEIAWGAGDRIAARSDGEIRIWQAGKLATLAKHTMPGLWWRSADELGAVYTTGTYASGAPIGARRRSIGGAIVAQPAQGGEPRKLAIAGLPAVPLVAGAARADVAVVIDRAVDAATQVAVLRGDRLDTIAIPVDQRPPPKDVLLQQIHAGGARICGLAVGDDGSRAAVRRGECVYDLSREIILLDLAAKTAKLVAVPHTAIAVTTDGAIVALWGGAIAKLVGDKPQVIAQHGANVVSLAVSPDRRTIAAGGADGRITLVSITGTVLGVLDAHSQPVRALAWSPDGSQLASAGADAMLVWDLRP
jgi:WD40 repeat protein